MSGKPTKYIMCIHNSECPDLEIRKVYRALPDPKAARDGYVRVVDESGEDYLYPAGYFTAISLSPKVKKTLAGIA